MDLHHRISHSQFPMVWAPLCNPLVDPQIFKQAANVGVSCICASYFAFRTRMPLDGFLEDLEDLEDQDGELEV